MVRLAGVEPAACRLGGGCSIQLSYRRFRDGIFKPLPPKRSRKTLKWLGIMQSAAIYTNITVHCKNIIFLNNFPKSRKIIWSATHSSIVFLSSSWYCALSSINWFVRWSPASFAIHKKLPVRIFCVPLNFLYLHSHMLYKIQVYKCHNQPQIRLQFSQKA